MLINVLVCHADGTATLESREVAEDWLSVSPITAPEEAPSTTLK